MQIISHMLSNSSNTYGLYNGNILVALKHRLGLQAQMEDRVLPLQQLQRAIVLHYDSVHFRNAN